MEKDKNYKIAEEAERLVAHIESNLEYDEEGRSYIKSDKIKEFLDKILNSVRNFIHHIMH